MLSLSLAERAWPIVVMVDLPNDSPAERRRMGRALALLRDDAAMTQPEAAEALGVTTQGWQNYEYGKRRFSRDLVDRVTAAVGRSAEDLMTFRAKVAAEDPAGSAFRRPLRPFELPLLGRVRAGPQGLHVYDDPGEALETKDFSDYFGPDWRVLQLGGESMIPWAEPGGFITYNVRRYPQRNKGCVIELVNGDLYVKRYDGVRGGTLHVTELHPEERQIIFNMTEVKGVYATGLRLD